MWGRLLLIEAVGPDFLFDHLMSDVVGRHRGDGDRPAALGSVRHVRLAETYGLAGAAVAQDAGTGEAEPMVPTLHPSWWAIVSSTLATVPRGRTIDDRVAVQFFSDAINRAAPACCRAIATFVSLYAFQSSRTALPSNNVHPNRSPASHRCASTCRTDRPGSSRAARPPGRAPHAAVEQSRCAASELESVELPRRRRHARVQVIDEALHLGRDVPCARVHHVKECGRHVPVGENPRESART